MVSVKCDNCGEKTRKSPNKVKQYVRHFCSRICYTEWMRKNPKKMGERARKVEQKKEEVKNEFKK